jgi:hypothetical protein
MGVGQDQHLLEVWPCGTRWPSAWSAHTRFNDYIGTVAADDAEAIKGQQSLYDLADIDRDL